MPSDVTLIEDFETPKELRDDESCDVGERLQRALEREKLLMAYVVQQKEETISWLKVKEDRWSDVLEQIGAEGGTCQMCSDVMGERKVQGKRSVVPQLHLNNINNFLAVSPGQLTASSVSSNSTRSGGVSVRMAVPPLPLVPPCIPSLQLHRALAQISSRSLSGRMETPSSVSSDRTAPDRLTPVYDEHSPHEVPTIIDSQRESGRRVTPTTPCQVTKRVPVPSLRLGILLNKTSEVPVYINNQLSNRSSSLSPSSRQASPGVAFQKCSCEALSERSQSRSAGSARTIDSCNNRD